MNIEEAQDKIQVALEGMVQDLLFSGDYAGVRQELDEAWALIREAIQFYADEARRGACRDYSFRDVESEEKN